MPGSHDSECPDGLRKLKKFMAEEAKEAESPVNLAQLYKDLTERSGWSQQCSYEQIRLFRLRIPQLTDFDTEMKVRMLFVFSVPVKPDYLNELRQNALVIVDKQERIVEYAAKDGSFELKGSHSSYWKCRLAKNKKRSGISVASKEEDKEEDKEDGPKEEVKNVKNAGKKTHCGKVTTVDQEDVPVQRHVQPEEETEEFPKTNKRKVNTQETSAQNPQSIKKSKKTIADTREEPQQEEDEATNEGPELTLTETGLMELSRVLMRETGEEHMEQPPLDGTPAAPIVLVNREPIDSDQRIEEPEREINQVIRYLLKTEPQEEVPVQRPGELNINQETGTVAMNISPNTDVIEEPEHVQFIHDGTVDAPPAARRAIKQEVVADRDANTLSLFSRNVKLEHLGNRETFEYAPNNVTVTAKEFLDMFRGIIAGLKSSTQHPSMFLEIKRKIERKAKNLGDLNILMNEILKPFEGIFDLLKKHSTLTTPEESKSLEMLLTILRTAACQLSKPGLGYFEMALNKAEKELGNVKMTVSLVKIRTALDNMFEFVLS